MPNVIKLKILNYDDIIWHCLSFKVLFPLFTFYNQYAAIKLYQRKSKFQRFGLLKGMYLLVLICLSNYIFCQQVDVITPDEKTDGFFYGFTDADPFRMSGNLNLNMRSYDAHNIENRQSPFIWYLNSNILFNIYKIRIPFSAIISAQNELAAHPFAKETVDNFKDRRYTRIGASPYYKWIKLHVGHRSMNFSPFTMANHVFLGGGMELTPGKIRFSNFVGKMAKTEPRDLSLTGFNQAVFNRKGYGMKLGYGTNETFLDFILFSAKDDPSQLPTINQDSANVFKNENSVLAINGKAVLLDIIKLNVEIAGSGFTKNANDPSDSGDESSIHDFQLNRRKSTVYRKAINAGVTLDATLFSVGMGFKRIEPDFRSLGAYFFNNDLENYTFNLSFDLFNNKMKVNGTTGVQKNNLFGEKETQLNRNISSLNVNYFHKSLNIGLNYSNYSSEINYVINPELDSLNAVIVTNNASLSATYTILSKSNHRHLISLNLALQDITDDVEDFNRSAEARMINSILAYRFFPDESLWRFNSMINYNRNELNNILINRIGFGLGFERNIILDKLSVAFNSIYYLSSGQDIDNKTLNLKLSVPYLINEHNRINFGLLYLNRAINKTSVINNYQEITTILNYTYSF